MSDVIMILVRQMALILGGYIIAKGWADQSMVDAIVGGVVAGSAVIHRWWDWYKAQKPAGK